ncbi:MAG: peptidase M15 [Candidatus Coatesbacteria bacterium]|nr:peptidase M15 [Candidatus Coatesbacteria bacterium]
MRELNRFQLSDHFNLREFQCPCCGRVKLHSAVIDALEALRSKIGNKPIIIESGYRCAEHNEDIGGAPDSDHLYGWAVDVRVNEMSPAEIANAAKRLPALIKRLGLYEGRDCVHIGVVEREDFPSRWGMP